MDLEFVIDRASRRGRLSVWEGRGCRQGVKDTERVETQGKKRESHDEGL